MNWVIITQQNGKHYFLESVLSTGRAVWVAAEDAAKKFSSAKAAQYVIDHANLRKASIHILNAP